MIKHTGGCICGEVKYTVNLDEVPRTYNSHCIDCRKKMGGLNTIVEIRKGALSIDKNKLDMCTNIQAEVEIHYKNSIARIVYLQFFLMLANGIKPIYMLDC